MVGVMLPRYGSIQFGLENSPPSLEILCTETGERLGGKRAAIQFYHDRRSKDEILITQQT